VPLNDMPEIQRPYANYTVVGAGKTGMDACIWLLQNGVNPARIRWIMPRDAWMLDRASFQPAAENFERSIGSIIGQFEAIAEATSIPDLFERLEERGLLLRIDKSVEPTMYRCAVVSQAELEQLRRIKDVVRLGRLRSAERTMSTRDVAPCLKCTNNGHWPAIAHRRRRWSVKASPQNETGGSGVSFMLVSAGGGRVPWAKRARSLRS
jgi:hypothetical protein